MIPLSSSEMKGTLPILCLATVWIPDQLTNLSDARWKKKYSLFSYMLKMQRKLRKVKLTVCVSYLDFILKSSSSSNAKNHSSQLMLGSKSAQGMFWGGHNTNTVKTTQRKSMFNNWQGSRYGGLAHKSQLLLQELRLWMLANI